MVAEKTNKLRDVYGVGRDVPLNYVSRKEIDKVLVDHLTRDQHIVINGSSKQGETCLRKNCLDDNDYIVVTCLNRWDLGELHSAILKKAGYSVVQSEKKTASGKHKVEAQFVGEGGIPGLVKAKGTATVGHESNNQTETTSASLELDLHDVNDVISALKEIVFTKFIVLEDFHYLPVETQKDFAFALKAFHENSKFCFIVVGVWREQNRLIAYNGDLTSRVFSIDADKWSADELREVIQTGEVLLNIQFDEKFKRELIECSFESVMLVQEACFVVCEQAGVFETQSNLKLLAKDVDARVIVRRVVDDQKARYTTFLTNFADGFQETALGMYRWLLFPVLKADIQDLELGLRLYDIGQTIKSFHPEGHSLNTGNLTQALLYAASLQVKKDIRPIILDYDQTNRRLNVVDRGFLIWLSTQDRSELLDMVDLPKS